MKHFHSYKQRDLHMPLMVGGFMSNWHQPKQRDFSIRWKMGFSCVDVYPLWLSSLWIITCLGNTVPQAITSCVRKHFGWCRHSGCHGFMSRASESGHPATAAATIQEVKKCRVVWKVSKSIELEVSYIFALSHVHYFEWNSGVTCLNGKIYLTPCLINHPFHFTNPYLLIGLTMKDLPNCSKDKPRTVHHRAYTHTHTHPHTQSRGGLLLTC